MQEMRLLERYADTLFEAPKARDGYQSQGFEVKTARYLASIKGHLWRLLNTRKGSVLIDPEYGVVGMSVSDQALDPVEVQSELYRVVSKYEPRLSNLKVKVSTEKVGENLNCKFVILGVVEVNQDRLPVELNAALLPDGTCEFE